MMMGLRIIYGAVKGCLQGWLLGLLLVIPLWVIQFPNSNQQGARAWNRSKYVCFDILPILGGAFGMFQICKKQFEEESARLAKEKRAAEAKAEAKRRADEARVAAEKQRLLERDNSLLQLRQIASRSQTIARSLAITLAKAEVSLNQAEKELKDRVFSPFWEAVEDSTSQLNDFNRSLDEIDCLRKEYEATRDILGPLGQSVPTWGLGINLIPSPSPIHKRLAGLYREGQKDPQFASIYEHRRIASKIDKTNELLQAGFSNLTEAIHQLGNRVADRVDDLSAEIGIAVGDVESSLQCVAISAEEQRSALLAEIERSSSMKANLLQSVKNEAEALKDQQHSALKMLDNIQRGRRPLL